MSSYDAGPLFSPAEFRQTENLLAAYVRRKQAGIPMTKRLPATKTAMLKALNSSAEKSHMAFAQLHARLDAMKSAADRRMAMQAKREKATLAKAIADTRELLHRNPNNKSASWLASVECRIDAFEAMLKP